MGSLKDLSKMIRAANKERSPDQEFLYMLNETIIREQVRRPPSQSFHPSSLGGCLRRNFYEITGAPIDEGNRPDPSGVGIAESGTDRHERIQNYVQKMRSHGFDCDWIDPVEYLAEHPQPGTRVVERKGNEVKLFNSILNMSFMCDGIIRLMKKLYILEIKTEISFKWISRTEIVGKHKIQAACYSSALGIDDVLFLYENRDVCTKKPFVVHISDMDRQELVVDRIEECNTYAEEGKVPPMTTMLSECKYCPFTTTCKRDGETLARGEEI